MRVRLALVPLLLCCAGCPAGPFTRAAGAYAKASAASSTALGAAPSLLARSCTKSADVEYVQSRLTRLKFETEGIKLPAEGDYYVPWEAWLTRAHPRGLNAGSWATYCGEIEQTGKAFSSAVGALGAYAAALDSLVEGSAYEGTDLGKTVDGVNKIVASVSASESGPSKAVSAVGSSLDKFAGVVLRERVEKDLEAYVRLADPEVQRLVVALRAYVAATRVDVEGLLANQSQVVVSFEKLTGLGEATTIAPCRVGAAAPAVGPAEAGDPAPLAGKKKVEPRSASPELGALRREVENQRKALVDVCRSLDQLEKTTNAQKLLAFHALAVSTEEDIRATRAVLTGFEEVLGNLASSHAALVKASYSSTPVDLKTLFGAISELATRLGALQAALAQTKK